MKKINLIYPKLCYKLVGLAFDVYNQIGYGFREKYYQKAYEKLLKKNKIKFKKEFISQIKIYDEFVANQYLDFLIENKIVIEFKSTDKFKKYDIQQVYQYLVNENKKLGILISFTKNGVLFKRIINIK